MGVVGDPGQQVGDQGPAGAGGGPGVLVGGGALGGDRVGVQQVARLLRDQADPAHQLAGRGAVRDRAAYAHRTGGRFHQSDQGVEERGLPGTVAAHQGHGLAGRDGEVDAVQRPHPASAYGERAHLGGGGAGGRHLGGAPAQEPAPGGVRTGSGGLRVGVRRAAGRGLPVGQSFAQCAGPAPGVPDGERQRGPARQPAQVHHRREHRGHRHHLRRAAEHRRGARRRQQHDLVGVLHHPLEPVLGQQHRRAEVVHQPLEDGQHLLGGGRVQRGGRLVEDQHLRVRGEDGADRHPLPLAAGERRDRTVPQPGEAQQIEGLLDAPPHHVRGQAQRLHAVGEFVLDGVGDEVRERVLAHRADHVGQFARLVGTRVAARDRHPAAQGAAGEVRDEPAHRAEHGRLADAGRADEKDEFPLRHLEVHAPHGGSGGAVVCHGDVLEADHDGCSSAVSGGGEVGRAGATRAGRRPRSTAAAGHNGSVGATSGTTPGCRAAGSADAAHVSATATAAPEPATSRARGVQVSGR